MNSLEQADLTEAAHIYAVANTPLYLIRMLRQDPTVYEISKSFSGDEILTQLSNALRVKPESPVDYVRPFVYLAALWHKPEEKYLKMSPRIPDVGETDWFNYVRRVLLETYSPTISQNIQLPPRVRVATPSLHTDAPSEFLEIDLRKGH
jgi:hypothetical protein